MSPEKKTKKESSKKPAAKKTVPAKPKAETKTAVHPKTEAPSAVKPEAKSAPAKTASGAKAPAKPAAKTEAKKSNKAAYPAPVKHPKPKHISKMRDKIAKKNLPTFRGRFGKRGGARRVANEKWQKWRYPRGIDVWFKREDGAMPGSGYRTPLEIRGRHPSGYKTVLVHNLADLEAVRDPDTAVIIARTVGRKKRAELLTKADAKKQVVLNR